MAYGTLGVQREKLEEFGRRYGVKLLIAFGSQVTGPRHPGTDLDLALLMENGAGTRWEVFSALYEAFPREEVDLVWLDRADPLLAWNVFRQGRLLLGDPRDFTRYATYAWRRFVEYQPFCRLEAQAVRQAIREHLRADR